MIKLEIHKNVKKETFTVKYDNNAIFYQTVIKCKPKVMVILLGKFEKFALFNC